MGKNWRSLLGILSLWGLTIAIVWSAHVIKHQKQLDVTEIERVVQQYLLNNPRLIVEMENRLRAQELAEEAAAVQRTQEAVGSMFNTMLDAPGELSSTKGPAKKDYILWYFTQPQCPSCHRADHIVQEATNRHTELEQRVFYWPFFGGEALRISKLVMAAQHQGLANSFYQAVISHNGTLTSNQAQKLAGALPGMNMDKLLQDAEQPQLAKALKDNFILASKLHMTGTPTVILTDKFGKQVEVISGFSESLKSDLEDRISKLKTDKQNKQNKR